MPTRKQKRREAKAKRHDYEFVYVDGEGNELDEVPDELAEPKERQNGSKPATAKKPAPQARGARGARVPPVPSWNRALKRGGMLGVVVFALFSLTSKGNYVSILPLALVYTALFVPFTYFIDRFAYRRWQARQDGAAPRAPKKR
jgi:hypothetical protein